MMNNQSTRLRVIGILAVIVIVALTAYAYSMREQIVALRRYGYIGIWLIEFIANASVLLPIPGSLVTAAMIPLLHSPLLAIIASNAAAVGELTAYMAGLGGSVIIENANWYERVKKVNIKIRGSNHPCFSRYSQSVIRHSRVSCRGATHERASVLSLVLAW